MRNLQKEIREYIEERDWSILNRPDWIAKSISIESAELLELFQFVDKSKEEVLEDEKMLQNIKDELADVLMYTLEMAESLNFSLEEAWRDKFERIKHKYSVEAMKEGEEAYYRIKKEHRDKKD